MELKLISKSKAAALLGVGKKNLEILIQLRKIKVIFLGKRVKIPVSEIESFIKNNASYSDNSEFILERGTRANNRTNQNQFNSKSFFENLIAEA